LTRKSPVRHHVRSHRRQGHIIRSYIRGRGTVFPQYSRRAVEDFSKSHEPREYTVTFKYLDRRRETVKTIAHSPKEAILFADTRRARKTQRPVEIVVKNMIGAIVGKIGAKFIGGIKEMAAAYKEHRALSREEEEARKEHLELLREKAELEKEKRLEVKKARARAGDVAMQRYLTKKGITW